MEGTRVVVLVSEDISDVYFANRLLKELNVVGVFVERQHGTVARPASRLAKALKYSVSPGLFVKKVKEEFYGRRYGKRAIEIAREGFGPDGAGIQAPEGTRVVYTEGVNAINDPVYVEQIRKLQPEVIAVCGTSILKKPLLSIPPKGLLNLHGGLAQRYRGVWTTLWAVYNEEPEYVGATVHYVSEGIDDGRVIYQGSPGIGPDDNHETLYVKVVKLGVELMVRAIRDIEDGTVKSYPLETKGKLYLRSAVTPEVIAEVWKKVAGGVIRDYVRGENEKSNAQSGPERAIKKAGAGNGTL